MTDKELKEIEQRAGYAQLELETYDLADQVCSSDVPALCKEVRRLREEVETWTALGIALQKDLRRLREDNTELHKQNIDFETRWLMETDKIECLEAKIQKMKNENEEIRKLAKQKIWISERLGPR